MKRTLTLTRESLTELTCHELDAVAGAGYYTVPTCQVDRLKAVIVSLVTELPEVTRTCTL